MKKYLLVFVIFKLDKEKELKNGEHDQKTSKIIVIPERVCAAWSTNVQQ
jgi:hypothetical protein